MHVAEARADRLLRLLHRVLLVDQRGGLVGVGVRVRVRVRIMDRVRVGVRVWV